MMLADELANISGYISKIMAAGDQGCTAINLEAILADCEDIKAAWRRAAFSNVEDHGLRRYFNYHLEGIAKLSDTLYTRGCHPDIALINDGLLELIDHIGDYFDGYMDDRLFCPKPYASRMIAGLTNQLQLIERGLAENRVGPRLSGVIQAYFQSMLVNCEQARFSFRTLRYFQVMVTQLAELTYEGSDLEARINTILCRYNFNHLSYFAYLQQEIRGKLASLPVQKKLCFLNAEYLNLQAWPEHLKIIFHPDWPSLRDMLANFLQEEIRHLEKLTDLKEKIALNMSVAQLACWLKLFQDESLFGTENLTAVFKSATLTYQTKRQASISAKSLSKEYYAISQITAAVTRDKLLKMVERINREFFPV